MMLSPHWPVMVRPRIRKLKAAIPAGFGSSRLLTWQVVYNDYTPTLFSSFSDARDYVAYY